MPPAGASRAPVLVVVGADETRLADAPDVWRRWADDVTATQAPGGSLRPRGGPAQVVEILAAFLEPRSAGRRGG